MPTRKGEWLRKHAGEVRYFCPYCFYGTMEAKHMRTHLGTPKHKFLCPHDLDVVHTRLDEIVTREEARQMREERLRHHDQQDKGDQNAFEISSASSIDGGENAPL